MRGADRQQFSTTLRVHAPVMIILLALIHQPAHSLQEHNSQKNRSNKVQKPVPAPKVQNPVPAPKVQKPVPAPKVQNPVLAPKVQNPVPAPKVQKPVPAPKVQNPVPAPKVQNPVPAPKVQNPVPAPKMQNPVPAPKVQKPVPAPKVQKPVPAPKVQKPVPAPKVQNPVPAPKVQNPVPAPKMQNPVPAPKVQKPVPAPKVQKPVPAPPPPVPQPKAWYKIYDEFARLTSVAFAGGHYSIEKCSNPTTENKDSIQGNKLNIGKEMKGKNVEKETVEVSCDSGAGLEVPVGYLQRVAASKSQCNRGLRCMDKSFDVTIDDNFIGKCETTETHKTAACNWYEKSRESEYGKPYMNEVECSKVKTDMVVQFKKVKTEGSSANLLPGTVIMLGQGDTGVQLSINNNWRLSCEALKKGGKALNASSTFLGHQVTIEYSEEVLEREGLIRIECDVYPSDQYDGHGKTHFYIGDGHPKVRCDDEHKMTQCQPPHWLKEVAQVSAQESVCTGEVTLCFPRPTTVTLRKTCVKPSLNGPDTNKYGAAPVPKARLNPTDEVLEEGSSSTVVAVSVVMCFALVAIIIVAAMLYVKKTRADQKGKKDDAPTPKEVDPETGMKVNRKGKLKSEAQFYAEKSQVSEALTDDGRNALQNSQVDTTEAANSVQFASEFDAFDISGRTPTQKIRHPPKKKTQTPQA